MSLNASKISNEAVRCIERTTYVYKLSCVKGIINGFLLVNCVAEMLHLLATFSRVSYLIDMQLSMYVMFTNIVWVKY